MDEKKTNGHDPMTVRMVEVLERIEGRLERIETEARGTNKRLDETNERLGRVEKNVELLVTHAHASNERIAAWEERLSKDEERIARLEARLAT